MTLVVCVSALIYVLDSHARDGLAEAFNELSKLLQEKELKDASVLIFANKQVCCAYKHCTMLLQRKCSNITISFKHKFKNETAELTIEPTMFYAHSPL